MDAVKKNSIPYLIITDPSQWFALQGQ